MRMTEVGGMRLERRGRKRKLPFNWDDVYQSSSEDEKNIIKKKVLPHVHLLFSAQSRQYVYSFWKPISTLMQHSKALARMKKIQRR